MVSPIIEASYRNKFEVSIAEQLEAGGVEFTYETLKLPIEYPPRTGRYTPDFIPSRCRIIIEGKGYFYDSASDRQKLVLAKAQHPELDIRLLFQNANTKIYKGSKTTYGKWATDHGFQWAEKIVPPEWIKEIKQEQKLEHRNRSEHAPTSPHRPRTSRKASEYNANGSLRSLRRTKARRLRA